MTSECGHTFPDGRSATCRAQDYDRVPLPARERPMGMKASALYKDVVKDVVYCTLCAATLSSVVRP